MRTSDQPLTVGIDWRRYTVLQSRDQEEIVTGVSQVLRPHSLHCMDVLDASCLLQRVTAGHVSAIRLRYGRSVVVDSGPLYSCYLVSLPLAGNAIYEHGGETVTATPRTATVLSPHQPFRIVMDAGYDQLIVRIDQRVMERARDARAGGSDDQPLQFKLAFETGSAPWAVWAAAAQALLSSDDFLTQVQHSPRLGVHLEQLLASSLLEAQPSTAAAPPGGAAAPLYVRKAEEYIHAHLTDPITVTDLAVHARVSTRSLYAGFKQHRDIAPMALVRRLRLEYVRHELLASTAGSATVTEIAFRWGFGHLGEFAAAYRQRFGETPSATLARAGDGTTGYQ
ncbi:AraC family transcriptional regulator [Embleya scabrispora]|uniref:AraC family transcriptional regulator n=1 Tax=Embleya scabrispora TaxID=159449 RepID=UPI0003A61E96|nr:AraC family transcriptional regulator [Embleya scabrispora]MYS79248.1 helix-turn-helix domain-containing protein [Streptomyces sp. SID5474]